MLEEAVAKIKNTNFLSFEFVPATGGIMSQIQSLSASGILQKIDGIICTDSPRACLKSSSILASILLQQHLHKPTICTMSMRDRNSLALQADLLGANEFDIRLFLALTGDPIKLGDQLQSKPVFEGSSKLLIQIIHALNRGEDLQGKMLKKTPKTIYPLCVTEVCSTPLHKIKTKMAHKIRNGVLAIITQPLYEIDDAKQILEWFMEINAHEGTDASLIFGFYPLVSYKAALFLNNNLPGMCIPKIWIQSLKEASLKGKEYERSLGVAMSAELFYNMQNLHANIHFMSSGHLKVAKDILLSS